MPIAPIAAGAAALGSFLQSNQQKNSQRANLAQQTSLDNQMLQVYDQLQGKFNNLWSGTNPIGSIEQAKNFYTSEVQGGLSPAVTGAAQSQFQQQNALNLATLKNQLGPYTPNRAGMIGDFGESEIVGNVSLQQQLAALNQQTRQQGAQGLGGLGLDVAQLGAGVSESVAQGIGGLASQYGDAARFNATNQTNPFTSVGSFLASNPNMFASTGIPGSTPGLGAPVPPGVPNGLSGQPWYPQPGQGGLGVTGGTGLPPPPPGLG